MAKPELGLKRICGSCGAKFYDLARDPVICPKCGTPYVATAASARAPARAEPVAAVVEEPEPPAPVGAEVISLEEADAEANGKKKVPAAEGEEEVEVAAAEEDDTFLEEEEEEPGDVSDIIGEKLEEDEES